jgi:hypothetical protein
VPASRKQSLTSHFMISSMTCDQPSEFRGRCSFHRNMRARLQQNPRDMTHVMSDGAIFKRVNVDTIREICLSSSVRVLDACITYQLRLTSALVLCRRTQPSSSHSPIVEELQAFICSVLQRRAFQQAACVPPTPAVGKHQSGFY